MPPKDTIVVVKIPSSKKFIDHPQTFPKTEQLYLELIENKTKIKQNLVNKDYKPPSSSTEKYSSPEKENNPTPPLEVETPVESFSPKEIATPISIDERSPSDEEEEPERVVKSEDLSQKLQNLLKSKKTPSQVYNDKYSQERTQHNFNEYQKSRNRLPTLSELEKQGEARVPREFADASRMSIENEDLKREMLFKFDLLRKSYKEQTIPTFSIHSDLDMMKKSYEDTVKRLSLDNSVESYKRYLIGAFMLIEFVLGKWLHFDMKGYTQQQIVSMSMYEKLLIELGEKSYIPDGSKFPVEIRLLFLVMIQTAFFIVGKMIFNKTGENIMNAINNMNKATTPGETPKKKMQGPSINIDDLPDISELQ